MSKTKNVGIPRLTFNLRLRRIYRNNDTLTLNRLTEQEYVVWHLTAHNDVIFQMKPLVAFSDRIKFKWHFSLRLSTIMLGSYFFYNASGKGYLIFKKAKQELSSELGDDNYVDFYRHLAFDKKTKFSLKVSLNPWDTLTSGFNVHNIDNTPSIIDADILDRKKKSTSGVLRYVKYYLIPF